MSDTLRATLTLAGTSTFCLTLYISLSFLVWDEIFFSDITRAASSLGAFDFSLPAEQTHPSRLGEHVTANSRSHGICHSLSCNRTLGTNNFLF